jgi:hypothetical protein
MLAVIDLMMDKPTNSYTLGSRFSMRILKAGESEHNNPSSVTTFGKRLLIHINKSIVQI